MKTGTFCSAQYFMNNYNHAMSTLPIVKSQVQILRIEVWVTNRQGYDTSSRQIVGLMDLGEQQPYNSKIHSLTSIALSLQHGEHGVYQHRQRPDQP